MIGDVDIGQLYDREGRRRYLCEDEMARFMRAVSSATDATRTFCLVLALTGCRISEALALTSANIDYPAKRLIFRTLKRRRTAFRAVPIPDNLLSDLAQLVATAGPAARLFPWARQTAYRKVKRVMARAGVAGPMAMPKGLRHAYGLRAAAENVPPNLIQRWLGHAKPDTTALYLDAMGKEERAFARRMW